VNSWRNFIAHCSDELRRDVKKRATPDEWRLVETSDQPTLLSAMEKAPSAPAPEEVTGEAEASSAPQAPVLDDIVKALNDALARSDATAIKEMLGQIARDRGMSQLARETGFARESLYRSLDPKGNPEFTTVLKVLSSIGLRLEVKSEKGGVGARASRFARLSSALIVNGVLDLGAGFNRRVTRTDASSVERCSITLEPI
jgi:probable addiction module antidote protein